MLLARLGIAALEVDLELLTAPAISVKKVVGIPDPPPWTACQCQLAKSPGLVPAAAAAAA